jgi:hypothetical protein
VVDGGGGDQHDLNINVVVRKRHPNLDVDLRGKGDQLEAHAQRHGIVACVETEKA